MTARGACLLLGKKSRSVGKLVLSCRRFARSSMVRPAVKALALLPVPAEQPSTADPSLNAYAARRRHNAAHGAAGAAADLSIRAAPQPARNRRAGHGPFDVEAAVGTGFN